MPMSRQFRPKMAINGIANLGANSLRRFRAPVVNGDEIKNFFRVEINSRRPEYGSHLLGNSVLSKAFANTPHDVVQIERLVLSASGLLL
jgi:hypothetical protein